MREWHGGAGMKSVETIGDRFGIETMPLLTATGQTIGGMVASASQQALPTVKLKSEFMILLDRLIKSYLLLVSTDAAAQTRLRISYCLDLPLDVEDPRTTEERLLAGLGWDATRVNFQLEAAADTELVEELGREGWEYVSDTTDEPRWYKLGFKHASS